MIRFILPIVILLSVAGAQAELPPYVYRELQAKADEFVRIKVLSSKKDSDPDAKPTRKGAQIFRIHLSAKVLEVTRSKSGLKSGDVISIDYDRTEQVAGTGWVGPSEIPVLKEGDESDAYLEKIPKSGIYSPAARGQSFQTLKE